jgi:hypothetical protein
METYDPLLRARKEALADLAEDLTDAQYALAEKVIDVLLDKIDYEIEHADKMLRNQETGHLKVIVENPDGV